MAFRACVCLVAGLTAGALPAGEQMGAWDSPDGRLVARTDFEMGSAWTPKDVMGRNFWPIFKPAFWTCDTPEWKADGQRLGKTWPPLDVYRDAAMMLDGTKGVLNDIVKDRQDYLKRGPGDYPKPLKLGDFFAEPVKTTLRSNPKPDKPLMLEIQTARPAFKLKDGYEMDLAGFAEWKKAHPNFVGFRTMAEFDSDSLGYEMRVGKIPDEALRQDRLAAFGACDSPKARLAAMAEGVRRTKPIRFNEPGFWSMHSSSLSMGHQMANLGAIGLFYEATSQECGRWQVAGAFLRGAARQFGIPYGWYVATWCTSFTRGGERITAANGMESWKDRNHWPLKGQGRSVADRQQAYGYLIGNTYMEIEGPHRTHLAQKDAKPPTFPSDFAKDLDALDALSRRIDRGGVYAPVALLTPLDLRYTSSGTPMFDSHPYAFNSFFFTLCPTRSDIAQNDLRRRGFSSRLYNSEFGEFYDVLVPDSDQAGAKFASALSAYKAAFLLGEYERERLDAAALAAYVRGGGTLFVPADKVLNGLVPQSLAGLGFDATTLPSQGLGESYAWHRLVGAGTAKPVAKDKAGTPYLWVNAVGKGRVVVSAAEHFLPAEYATFAPARKFAVVNEITQGKRTFSHIRDLLLRVQAETMPVVVKGDIQWGINFVEGQGSKVKGQTKERGGHCLTSGLGPRASHWLLWLFNNNGVTKFALEPEEFDPKATVTVTVDFRRTGCTKATDLRARKPVPVSGTTLSVDVGPGEWRLIGLD